MEEMQNRGILNAGVDESLAGQDFLHRGGLRSEVMDVGRRSEFSAGICGLDNLNEAG